MARLILVSGPPGAGKSTLAEALCRRLGLTWLDKDCIDEPFSPGDRGDHYTREVEPKVIQALLNLAAINLRGGQNVVIDLPWSHVLLNERDWIKKIQAIDAAPIAIELVVSSETLRDRMIQRNLKRDRESKLSSDQKWSEFLKRDRVGEKIPVPHHEINADLPLNDYLESTVEWLEGQIMHDGGSSFSR